MTTHTDNADTAVRNYMRETFELIAPDIRGPGGSHLDTMPDDNDKLYVIAEAIQDHTALSCRQRLTGDDLDAFEKAWKFFTADGLEAIAFEVASEFC